MGYTNDFFNGFIKWGVLLPDLRFFGYTGMEKSTGRDVDLYFLGGQYTSFLTANEWTAGIDNYHGNAVYLCATTTAVNDPFKSASFILRVYTAYTGNNPRTIQEAISVYGASTGTRRYRVYSSDGWSQWFTVGTL